MHRINSRRVLGGGLVAGLILNFGEFVINQVILGPEWLEVFSRHNLPPISTLAAIGFFATTLVLGIALIWLYAAIRPRFGPGPVTAVLAAVFLWFTVFFFSALWLGLMNILPLRLVAISTVWGLGETIISTIAGAAIYRE